MFLYGMLVNLKALFFLVIGSMGGTKIKQSSSTKYFHNTNQVEKISFPDMFLFPHLELTNDLLYIKNSSKICFGKNLAHEKSKSKSTSLKRINKAEERRHLIHRRRKKLRINCQLPRKKNSNFCFISHRTLPRAFCVHCSCIVLLSN